jgi:hypothetical protein
MKDISHESGLRAMNTGGPAGWAEILTGKSACQDIAFGQLLDPSDVTEVDHIRKTPGQHPAGYGVVLGNNLYTVPRSLQAQFQSADPSE